MYMLVRRWKWSKLVNYSPNFFISVPAHEFLLHVCFSTQYHPSCYSECQWWSISLNGASCLSVRVVFSPYRQDQESTRFGILWLLPWDPPSLERLSGGVLRIARGMPGIHLLHLLCGLPRPRGRNRHALKHLVPSQAIFPVFNLSTAISALCEWAEIFEQEIASCQMYLKCQIHLFHGIFTDA